MSMSPLSHPDPFPGSPLFFYGCGPLLEECFGEICALIGRRPDGLIDSDPKKIGRSILGYICESPVILSRHERPVVIVTARRHWPVEDAALAFNPTAQVLHVVFQAAFHKAVRLNSGLSNNTSAVEPYLANEFRGARALVTGATRGIGLVIATQLAAQGFNIVIGGRDQESLKQVSDSLRRYGGEVTPVCADLGNEKGLSDFLAHPAVKNLPIDLLYNNAGVATPNRFILEEPVTMQDMLKTYAVNVVAPIAISEHFLRLSSQDRPIRIVFLTSNLSSHLNTTYTATKFAMHKYVKDAQEVYLRRGAGLYLLDPGDVRTTMNPNGIANLNTLFPAAFLPLYCQSRQGIGTIHGGEFSEMTIEQAVSALIVKYGAEWSIKPLTTQMRKRTIALEKKPNLGPSNLNGFTE